MLKNFFFAATLLLLTTLFQDTHACSALPRNTSEIYDSFDFVFAGNVTHVYAVTDDINADKIMTDDINADKIIMIKITEIWKGDDNLTVGEALNVSTGGNSALCGINAGVNESWIIFSGSPLRASNTESNLYTENLSTELDTLSAPPEEDDATENTQASCGARGTSCVNYSDCCGTDYCHKNLKCKAANQGNGNNRYLRSSFVH